MAYGPKQLTVKGLKATRWNLVLITETETLDDDNRADIESVKEFLTGLITERESEEAEKAATALAEEDSE